METIMFIKKAKMFLLICLLAFAMCSMFTAKTFGQGETVLRVDNFVANENGDGSSWAAAYKTLWAALERANNIPDAWEIRVAEGIEPYTPQQPDLPFIIRDMQFLGQRVVLRGGYAGKAGVNPNPDLRDPKAFPTILSGDYKNPVDSVFGTRFDPLTEDNWKDDTRFDNAQTVVMVSNSRIGSVIDGFIIEAGAGGTVFFENQIARGGGILIINSRIDVVNCTFRYNYSGVPQEFEEDPLDVGKTSEGGGATVIGGFVENNDVDFYPIHQLHVPRQSRRPRGWIGRSQ